MVSRIFNCDFGLQWSMSLTTRVCDVIDSQPMIEKDLDLLKSRQIEKNRLNLSTPFVGSTK